MGLSYTYATLFLVALILSRALAPFVASLAVRLGALDLPQDRKVHRGVVPRLGGLAPLGGMLVPVCLLLVVDTDVARQFRQSSGPLALAGLGLGLLPVVALGLVDDLRGTSALLKFPVQVLAGVIAFAGGCRIEELSNPFTGVPLELGYLSLPMTVLWIVMVTNAINLIDGLDGLATGITAFVAATLFTLSKANDNVAVAAISLSLCGAAVGFLRYNFPPATIFLGDTGSLSMGYLLGVLSISGAQKSSTAVALFVPVVVLGVPLFDTVTSFWRRLLRLRHPFRADSEHIHHRILARGVSHRSATLILYGVTGVLMVLALVMAYFEERASLKPVGWTLFATAAFLLSVGGFLGYLNIAELRLQAAHGVRNRRLHRRRHRILEDLRQQLARRQEPLTPTGVYDILCEQLELLDFECYELQAVDASEERRSKPCGLQLDAASLHARPILLRGVLTAQLVAGRSGNATSRAQDAEVLDELLALLTSPRLCHEQSETEAPRRR